MSVSKDPVTGRTILIQKIINLIPKKLRLYINPSRKGVEEWMIYASSKMKSKSLLLDAGAGPCPYKHYFPQCIYEATDVLPAKDIDFVGSLSDIPKKSNTYDYIISTQVLEHVDNPEAVIKEMYRILKPKGKLFLTAPQNGPLHQEPYHFYNFTKYGLQRLLDIAKFETNIMKPNGGYWHHLSNVIRDNELTSQIKTKPLRWLVMLFERPICGIIIPLLLYPLDFFDKEKKYTSGWLVEATK
jgi:SAM-dependent methyltransferase